MPNPIDDFLKAEEEKNLKDEKDVSFASEAQPAVEQLAAAKQPVVPAEQPPVEKKKRASRRKKAEPVTAEQPAEKTEAAGAGHDEVDLAEEWEKVMSPRPSAEASEEAAAKATMSEEEKERKTKGYSTRDYRRFNEKGEKREESAEKAAEKSPAEKVEAEKAEKIEMDALKQKLEADRSVCAEALYQKEKAGKELDKHVGFFKRIFMGETKRETLRGENEDYKKLDANYLKSQEGYKETLKRYRSLLIDEKNKELKAGSDEFVKSLPQAEKITPEARQFIKAGDLETIFRLGKKKEGLANQLSKKDERELLSEEEKKAYEDAVSRRDKFLYLLQDQKGIKKEEAEALYNALSLKEDRNRAELERYAKGVIIETTAKQAIELNNLKYEKEIDDRKNTMKGKFLENIKTTGLQAGQWYRKLSFKQKIGYTALLLGGAAGAPG